MNVLGLTIVTAVVLSSTFAFAGEVKTQESAKAFCESSGKRLPTARELAEGAMKRNALGILEVTDASEAGSGYYPVTVRETNGSTDTFYYSHSGFESKNEDDGVCIWASSVNPDYPLTYGYYNVLFNLKSGRIDDHVMTGRNSIVKCSVKCVE